MKSFVLPNEPFFLPPLQTPAGGVDFLGLRQANLDMAELCLPGFNNVTEYIRPFTLVCWIYWRFYELCKENAISEPSDSQLKVFREKIETLFVWGNKLQEKRASLPGNRSTVPNGGEGKIPLNFEAWRRTTSLMAPVQYGPASKAPEGLGFLLPSSIINVAFKPTPAGVELAKVMHEKLEKVPKSIRKIIDNFTAENANVEQARELWAIWDIAKPTAREQKIFRQAFFDPISIGNYETKIGCRSTTVSLIRSLLKQANHELSLDDIRQALVHRRLAKGKLFKIAPLETLAQQHWSILQIRQLQRLALESLLTWIEHRILNHHEADIDSMMKSAVKIMSDKKSLVTTDKTFSEIAYHLVKKTKNVDELLSFSKPDNEASIFTLIGRLEAAHYNCDYDALVPISLQSLVLSAVLTEAFCKIDSVSGPLARGGHYRISLRQWLATFKHWRDQPISEALRYILEAKILSQHFATAVSRFDTQTQKLRIIIEEDGLKFISDKNQPWRPLLSRDRLATCLSLMADCDIISCVKEGGIIRYST